MFSSTLQFHFFQSSIFDASKVIFWLQLREGVISKPSKIWKQLDREKNGFLLCWTKENCFKKTFYFPPQYFQAIQVYKIDDWF